jgi:putative transposase
MIERELFETARIKNIFVMGYVLMPDHIHLIAGSNEGGKGISRFIHSLKGIIRKRLTGDNKLWQDRFDDLVLTSEKQFEIKLNYIHTNPVRAGLVDDPAEWRYSSYRDWKNQDGSRGVVLDYSWLE